MLIKKCSKCGRDIKSDTCPCGNKTVTYYPEQKTKNGD